MQISFGNILLTKPQDFYLKTDTPEIKEKIDKSFNVMNKFLDLPCVQDAFGQDTIELKRSKSKKNCLPCIIKYNNVELPLNIQMSGLHVYSILEQISYARAFVLRKFPENCFADITKRVFMDLYCQKMNEKQKNNFMNVLDILSGKSKYFSDNV